MSTSEMQYDPPQFTERSPPQPGELAKYVKTEIMCHVNVMYKALSVIPQFEKLEVFKAFFSKKP